MSDVVKKPIHAASTKQDVSPPTTAKTAVEKKASTPVATAQLATSSAPPTKKQKHATPASCSNNQRPATLVESTLSRLTRGLPKRELRLMVSEADDCEPALMKDIEVLERALQSSESGKAEEDEAAVNAILESNLTPLDTVWTVSALLGRLRDDLSLPSILAYNGSGSSAASAGLVSRPPSRSNTPTPGRKPAETAAAMVSLQNHPAYVHLHDNTVALLAAWKKISTNRLAAVFKRPVKPEEAPGYTDRIVFPMDLSLLRKMIVARQVRSFADMHQYIGLISHNCVKYNGRESDYGIVARDFEAMADHAIRQAVVNYAAAMGAAAATASAPAAAVTNAPSTQVAAAATGAPASSAVATTATATTATMGTHLAKAPPKSATSPAPA